MYFQEFCAVYNDGQLEEAYYNDGDASKLPQNAMKECKRTKHDWKFKRN